MSRAPRGSALSGGQGDLRMEGPAAKRWEGEGMSQVSVTYAGPSPWRFAPVPLPGGERDIRYSAFAAFAFFALLRRRAMMLSDSTPAEKAMAA